MDEGDDQRDEDEQRRRWREVYGDMVPERIVDTKIGEDGKRYYKVQWAASTFEPAKNFLEAELLINKYWDPVEKKLKLPQKQKAHPKSTDGACSTSSSAMTSSGVESNKSSHEQQDANAPQSLNTGEQSKQEDTKEKQQQNTENVISKTNLESQDECQDNTTKDESDKEKMVNHTTNNCQKDSDIIKTDDCKDNEIPNNRKHKLKKDEEEKDLTEVDERPNKVPKTDG